MKSNYSILKKMGSIILLVFATISFSSSVSSIGSEDEKTKRLIISPNNIGGDYEDLFKPDARWDFVKHHIDVFSLHIITLYPSTSWSPEYLDDMTLSKLVKTLQGSRIKLGVEVGGLRPFKDCNVPTNWNQAGERQARRDLIGLNRVIEAGGIVDVIFMDAPFSYVMKGGKPGNCEMPLDVAASELADYMKVIRSRFPNVEFGFIEPVPWYTVGSYPKYPGPADYGDLIELIGIAVPIIERAGEKISFFLADSPYNWNVNTPEGQGYKKLVALEKFVRSLGLRFGKIYNDSPGHNGSDQKFFENTLQDWVNLNAAGGDPDDLHIWSWYPYPKRKLPETEPYTFTYVVREFIKQYR